MAVITISRQFGSGGDEIARRVCEILGYQQFDKLMLTQAARDAGLSDQEIIDYSEDNYKVRNFLDRLFGRSINLPETRVWVEDLMGARIAIETQLTEESALTLVQKAVRSAYQAGNLLIIGRGGQAILRDEPGVLHVRIEAPLEDRIQRVKALLRESKREFSADIELRRAAQDWIYERDASSAEYLRRFYQMDWRDPQHYHLIMNTGKLAFDQCAKVISRLAMEMKSPRQEVKKAHLR